MKKLLLIILFVLITSNVWAATWTAAAGGGNWNDNATWEEGGGYPQAGDTANLDAGSGNVTINVASACAIVNCTGYTGTLTQSAQMTTTSTVTLVSSMTFSYTGTPTWIMSGSNTITTGGKSFYNLTWSDPTDDTQTKTLADTLNIINNFTQSNNSILTIATSDINVGGSLTVNGSLKGRTITLNGSGTLTGGNVEARAMSTNITITGTYSLSGTLYFNGTSIDASAGTITPGTSTIYFVGVSATLKGSPWNNISVKSLSDTTNVVLTLGSDITANDITLINTNRSSSLACGTYNVTISGNLTNPTATAGVTTSAGQTFTFNGTTTISNDTNFQNFTINAGKTVTFTSGKTYNAPGTFTAAGTSGSPITLKASTPSSVAYFYPTTLGTVAYVNATDINSSLSGFTDQTPTMTSNTAPSGVVSADSEYDTPYRAWKALDKGGATDTTWASTNTGLPHYWQYQFASAPAVINGYSIMGRISSSATQDPKSWTFEGSNTGAFAGEETVLDTQTNVASWGNYEIRKYYFTNSTQYQYYRIDVSANQSGNISAINEVTIDKVIPITTTGGSVTNCVNWALASTAAPKSNAFILD